MNETLTLDQAREMAQGPLTDEQLRAGSLTQLLEQIQKGGDHCMIWPRKLATNGYGRVYLKDRKMQAHRWVYEQIIGPIPDGLFICHHCDRKACVNPAHLYAGTHADNMRDARERKRTRAALHPELSRKVGRRNGLKRAATKWCQGEKSPNAKITEEEARAIKSSTEQTKVLMARYGLSKGNIQKIRRGDTWKHI